MGSGSFKRDRRPVIKGSEQVSQAEVTQPVFLLCNLGNGSVTLGPLSFHFRAIAVVLEK